MAAGATRFLKNWMLPIAMSAGAAFFLLVHFFLPGAESGYLGFCKVAQPSGIALMLFLQLSLVAPKDLRPHRWHLRILIIQAVVFSVFAALALAVPEGPVRILLECVMLCFICPTAAAAGVITSKLGGDLAGIMTYTVFANLLAALMIPLMVPLVHPAGDIGFFALFWAIIKRVFSILVLPCIAAWIVRFCFPRIQPRLEGISGLAFYIWGICLMLSISLATSALVESKTALWLVLCIGVVSLVCCVLQFAIGRRCARRYGRAESITAGQALGQKNTGFIIWLGISYMTPVTSIAGGLYAIWHNLVNSWELVHSHKSWSQKEKV